MKTTLSPALVAGLLLWGCAAHHGVQNHIPANAGVYEDAEGYAVLSLLLSGATEETHAPAIRINLATHVESVNGTHSLEDCMKVPEDFREAANDYERRAASPYVLKKRFSLKAPYDLVGETRIVGIARRPVSATDTDSSQKISSGAFYLSPVGFDGSRSHAIAYTNYLCGNLCGWGGFHLLVKNAGRWEEAHDVTTCTWRY